MSASKEREGASSPVRSFFTSFWENSPQRGNSSLPMTGTPRALQWFSMKSSSSSTT